MSYLGLLLNNKADFLLEYNEHFNINLKETILTGRSQKLFLFLHFLISIKEIQLILKIYRLNYGKFIDLKTI